MMASTEELQEKNPRGIPRAPFIVSVQKSGRIRRFTKSDIHLLRDYLWFLDEL